MKIKVYKNKVRCPKCGSTMTMFAEGSTVSTLACFVCNNWQEYDVIKEDVLKDK